MHDSAATLHSELTTDDDIRRESSRSIVKRPRLGGTRPRCLPTRPSRSSALAPPVNPGSRRSVQREGPRAPRLGRYLAPGHHRAPRTSLVRMLFLLVLLGVLAAVLVPVVVPVLL